MTGNNYRNLKSKYLQVILLLHALLYQCTFADAESVDNNKSYVDDYTGDNSLIIARLRETLRKEQMMEEAKEPSGEQIPFEEMLRRRLNDRKMVQAISGDFLEENAELLPEPSPIIHNTSSNSDKRQGYMTLCHFKICNMGRPRPR